MISRLQVQFSFLSLQRSLSQFQVESSVACLRFPFEAVTSRSKGRANNIHKCLTICTVSVEPGEPAEGGQRGRFHSQSIGHRGTSSLCLQVSLRHSAPCLLKWSQPLAQPPVPSMDGAPKRKLAALNAELEQVTKELKRKTALTASRSSVSKYHTKVLRAIAVATSGSRAPAAALLLHRLHLDASLVDTLVSELLAWFEGADAEERLRYTLDHANPGSKPAVTSAHNFLQEQRLHAWVEQQNTEKGIAPAALTVLQVRSDLLPPSSAGPTGEVHEPKHRSRLQWLRRWRMRWGINLGSIAGREKVPVQDAQEKAPFRDSTALFWGLTELRKDQPLVSHPVQRGGRLAAPKMGPRSCMVY